MCRSLLLRLELSYPNNINFGENYWSLKSYGWSFSFQVALISYFYSIVFNDIFSILFQLKVNISIEAPLLSWPCSENGFHTLLGILPSHNFCHSILIETFGSTLGQNWIEGTVIVESVINFDDSKDSYFLIRFEKINNIFKFIVSFEDREVIKRYRTTVMTLSFAETIGIREGLVWVAICCCDSIKL